MGWQNYPEGSEYEYLLWLIETDYWADIETRLDPLRIAENEFWRGDLDDPIYEQAHSNFVDAQQEIHDRRWQREEWLYRLWLDTQLRQEGKTYAGVYEKEEARS